MKNTMIPVAVIDSGIGAQDIKEMQCKIETYEVVEEEGNLVLRVGGEDLNGHGSLCISTIYKECTQVEIISIKIFDKELKTSIKYLEYALECLLYRDVKIINLSLAMTEKIDTSKLFALCNKLEEQGKIIIAAVENGKHSSEPANYKQIIGVQGENIKDNMWELRFGNLNFIKQSIPFLHLDHNNTFQMFGNCNSSAAAMMTGIVAKMMLEQPDITKKDIVKKLKGMSVRKFNFEKNFSINRLHPCFKDESIDYDEDKLKKIENVLGNFFDIKDSKIFYSYALYSSQIGGRNLDYFTLMQCFEKEFDFKIENYRTVSKYDCTSIYSIYKFLMEELGW